MKKSAIPEGIRAYQDAFLQHEHARDRSWEHCYRHFQGINRGVVDEEREVAALHLAFYLASWGMYRGSSFLLQHAYTVHRNAVDVVVMSKFDGLRDPTLGSNANDPDLFGLITTLIDRIRDAYSPFGRATDTLVTKVILGTLGCLPASDQYFLKGCRSHGIGYSRINTPFLTRLFAFARMHQQELEEEQHRLGRERGVRYPFMKLVDMYFWQIGFRATQA